MAGTKISDLGAGGTIADTDLFPGVDVSNLSQGPAGSTVKWTAANVATYIGTEKAATGAEMVAGTVTNRFVTPENIRSFEKWVDLSRHGWDPGASAAVNNAAWVSAIDECTGTAAPVSNTRIATMPLIIPAGAYHIEEPLEALSVIGLRIVPMGYVEIYADANMEAIIRLNGVRNAQIGGGMGTLALRGTAQVDYPLYHIWDSGASLSSSTSTLFESIWVRNLTYIRAVQIGEVGTGTGVQVDNVTYRDILANGAWEIGEATWWQRGFSVGNATFGNNLNHHAIATKMALHKYNIAVDATVAAFWGGDVGRAEADFYINSTGYCRFTGFRSEHSERFAVSAGPSSGAALVTFSDCMFNGADLNADGIIIDWKHSGQLRLDQVTIAQTPEAPIISTNTSGNTLRIKLDGCNLRGSATYTAPRVADMMTGLAAGASAHWEDFSISNSAGQIQYSESGSTDLWQYGASQPLQTAGECSCDRRQAATNSTGLTSGSIYLAYFTAQKTEDITSLTITSGATAATAVTLCRYGVYSVATSGNITLIHSTANDTGLLAVANTAYPKALDTTWLKTAGTRYALAILNIGSNAPTVLSMSGQTAAALPAIWGKAPRWVGARAAQTDLPSSLTNAQVGDTGRCPFFEMTP